MICPLYPFIYLVSYLFLATWASPILLVTTQCYTLFQRRPLGAPIGWLLCPFDTSHFFLSTSLFSGTKDIPGTS